MITHLLCVDPAQRYTIDEFLAHPWCKEPLGSIIPARTPRVGIPLDSPLLQSARGLVPGRSPGVAALKEAFDVTYAVHRMEEEGNRHRGFLTDLNEEEEDNSAMANSRQGGGTNARNAGTHGVDPSTTVYHAGRAGPRDRGDRKRNFELNIGGATLLGYEIII